jgi:hypothetical protein
MAQARGIQKGTLVIQPAKDTYLFRLKRTSYMRTGVLGWLLFNGFLVCAFVFALLSAWVLPAYSHSFTPYLKWQDALVVLCWCVAFISLGGCVLVARFLLALRIGYRQGILTLVGSTTLSVRDLSPENLVNIFRIACTTLACLIVAFVGLVPTMLIGWTLHLPHPGLVILGTAAAIALSIAGLAITLAATTICVIGCIGCISFCRAIGSLQTYQLVGQTTLTIDDFELIIISPDKPESMISLNLFESDDQRHLLHLCKRWIDTQEIWNPSLGEEIEIALEKTKKLLTSPS